MCNEILWVKGKNNKKKKKSRNNDVYNVYCTSVPTVEHDIVVWRARAILSLYSEKFRPAIYRIRIPVTNTTTRDGSLKRKGFLYSLWFFSFDLSRLPAACTQPPAAGGSRSRLLLVVGQILYCNTHMHTLYLQYNTCTHATQIPRPICSRVLGPVFILYTSL